jgi:hypothetical protein
VVLLLIETVAGCTRAFELDATRGAAAALSGLLCVVVTAGLCVWGLKHLNSGVGLTVTAACIVGAWALTAVSIATSRRADRSA